MRKKLVIERLLTDENCQIRGGNTALSEQVGDVVQASGIMKSADRLPKSHHARGRVHFPCFRPSSIPQALPFFGEIIETIHITDGRRSVLTQVKNTQMP